jgi:hypothetical protein
MKRVDTHGRAYLHSNHSDRSEQSKQTTKQFRLYRKPKSLSSFIAGYKSSVTTQINNWIDDMHVRANQQNTHQCTYQKYNRKNKLWQPNYNDHIIRNDDEYWRIKNYIKNNPKNNPKKWTGDKFSK